ncbi:MAG: AAA family ATPase [Synechococcus sp.]
MKLLSCTLNSIRRHAELSLNFHPGLTLITGANESGKSSLVEALHRTLFLRSNATGLPVQRLRSLQHSGHPQVTLHFEAKGRAWILQKRFSGQSGTTNLSGAGEPTRLGSDAEEQLAALLGIDAIIGSRQAGRVLPSRWAHLWVMQGEGGRDLLQLGGDHYDLHSLIDQLEQRADAALQSPLDQQIHTQLETLVAASLTTRGTRHQSVLWQREQALHACEDQLATATANLQHYEQASAKLDALDDEQRQLEQERKPQLAAEKQLLMEEQQQQAQAEATRQALEQQLLPLNQHRQQLQRQLHRLQDTDQTLTQQKQQQTRVHTELEQLQRDLQEQSATLDQLTQQRNQLEQQRSGLEEQGLQLRRLDERLQLEQRLTQLNRQQQQLLHWKRQGQEITAALSNIRAPDAAGLRALQEQQRQLEALTIRQEAMAAVVTLACSDQQVHLDDVPMAPGESQQRTSRFSLTVGDGVKFWIVPGGGAGLETIDRERQALDEALRASLRHWQGNSVADLEARCQQRMELLTRQSLLDQHPPETRDTEAIRQAEAAAHTRLQILEEEFNAGQSADREALGADRDAKAIQQALLTCRQHYRETNERQQALQRQLETQEQWRHQHQQRHQELQLQREALGAEIRSLDQQRLALIRDHGTANRLADDLTQLDVQIRSLEHQLQALTQAARNTNDPKGSIHHRLQTVNQQHQQLQERLQTLSTERGALQERCSSLGSNNPYASAEEARIQLEQAQQAHSDEALQVKAHQHLLDLFNSARSDLSSRYTTPLSNNIARYLTPLLTQPDALCSLSYDAKNGLGDLRLQRDGLTLPFANLSGGMKEQLNAALRLALADTLRAGHDGCLPVLFDDAFSNTDPERLQAVLSMLRKAADDGLQIVVLSCDGEPYRPVADAVVDLN